ncbi:MAG: Gfo/Idh/MocA family protein [Chitinophagales bacterium]|jgi:predicted dehydrogenase
MEVTNKRIFRWGILGLGKIAHKFATDLQRLPNARLVAVASTDLQRARVFAEQYACEQAFGSYEELIQRAGVDVVYVATAHTGHYSSTMDCLRSGIPVLCEKPFAMNGQQAAEMAQLARERGVFLMEALWTVFIPGMVAVLEQVRSGKLGRIHSVKADFGFYAAYKADWRLFDPKLGGGALLDVGIYPVLLAMLIFGPPLPSGIHTVGTRTRDGVDETCSFIFQYEGNGLAMGHATVAADTPVEAWIYGEKGQIHIQSRWHHPTTFALQMHDGSDPEEFSFPYEGWGYHFEAAHVMDCLEAGKKESDRVPLEFSCTLSRTMDVMLAQMGVKYEGAC